MARGEGVTEAEVEVEVDGLLRWRQGMGYGEATATGNFIINI